MIVMAADYVGKKAIECLADINHEIDFLVIDTADRGGFNAEITETAKKAFPKVKIFNQHEINEEKNQELIKSREVELGLLAWWPYIIKKEIISLTKRGYINTHPSYLPYNRGKHPYFWNLVDETPFGATLHLVDENIDSGEIIVQKMIEIDWEDTGESLYKKSREAVVELLRENLINIIEGNISPKANTKEKGTFHLGKELEPFCQIRLDEEYSARMLLNIIRGRMFNGNGSATFFEDGKEYCISISIKEKNKL
jgi:methionyl-tRNA formyltransferase